MHLKDNNNSHRNHLVRKVHLILLNFVIGFFQLRPVQQEDGFDNLYPWN